MKKLFLSLMILLNANPIFSAYHGRDDVAWQPGEQDDFAVCIEQSILLLSQMHRMLQQPSPADPAVRAALAREAEVGMSALNAAKIMGALPCKPSAYAVFIDAIEKHNIVSDFYRNQDLPNAAFVAACQEATKAFEAVQSSCAALQEKRHQDRLATLRNSCRVF